MAIRSLFDHLDFWTAPPQGGASLARLAAVLAAVAVLMLLISAPAADARPALSTFQVNSTLDVPDISPSDGLCLTLDNTCTLRAAVTQSNAAFVDAVDIILPAGVYELSLVPSLINDETVGDLNFTAPMPNMPLTTVYGAGSDKTIIDGGRRGGILTIAAGRSIRLQNMTLRNGALSESGAEFGGAIRNHGSLDIFDSVIRDNEAPIGGGIANYGPLVISGSTLQNNTASGVVGTGGGLYNAGGPTHVLYSTFNDNKAGIAGAIYNAAGLFITNSTISGNRALLYPGGIENLGTINIYNATIVFNQANSSGGYAAEAGGIRSLSTGAMLNLRNTLVAGNVSFQGPGYFDCKGDIASYGGNLIGTVGSTAACTIHNLSGVWSPLDTLARLGPLADNGGWTQTHALLPGSMAIDAADSLFGCVNEHSVILPLDQRFAARSVDGDGVDGAWCDVGAYEYRPPYFLPLVRAE